MSIQIGMDSCHFMLRYLFTERLLDVFVRFHYCCYVGTLCLVFGESVLHNWGDAEGETRDR